ncbi:MAG: membrane protein [Pirellulaceae bacterium]|nr:MAG: membrane protein [Pirellulaceae bacterium]
MWAWLRLAGAILLLVVAWPYSRRMDYEHSIDSLFPPGDPIIQQFQEFERLFGDSQVVLVVYEDPELFAADGRGIRRVAQLQEELRTGTGIADLFSVATLDQILRRWGSGITRSDPVAQKCRELFTGFTHNQAGTVAAIMCILDNQFIARYGRRPIITFLREFVAKKTNPHGTMLLVGEPVMVSESFRLLENDANRLALVTTLLLGATILLTLRSIRWALIAMFTVQWTLVVTTGLLAALQMRLSMVSSMLSAVVTVVAVATVMHLAVGFERRRSLGLQAGEAWRRAWSELRSPVAWACITDAAGFYALRVAGIGPVRDFGLMMAIGSLLVWLGVWLLVPALATFAVRSRPRASGEGPLVAALARLGYLSAQRAGWTCLVAMAITAAAIFGNARLEIESDFTKNFRPDSPIAQAYNYVEQNLGGAGALDIVFAAPAEIDNQFIQKVLSLEEKLRNMQDPEHGGPAFSKVLSLADVAAAARQQRLLQLLPPRAVLEAVRLLAPKIYSSFSAHDPQNHRSYWRIMLRAYDRRRAATKETLVQKARQLVEAEFGTGADVKVVGFYVLLARLVGGILSDQWRCLAVAVLGVFICLAVALRHVIAALAAVITNMLPILVVLGVLGWCAIPLNMGAAMMAAVSMGLAVDSSVHYLAVFFRAFRSGMAPSEALREAQSTVGRALVFATLALTVGFTALASSQFMPTVYFGLLAGATLAGSLVGNLTLLPALMRLTCRSTTRLTLPQTPPKGAPTEETTGPAQKE